MSGSHGAASLWYFDLLRPRGRDMITAVGKHFRDISTHRPVLPCKHILILQRRVPSENCGAYRFWFFHQQPFQLQIGQLIPTSTGNTSLRHGNTSVDTCQALSDISTSPP